MKRETIIRSAVALLLAAAIAACSGGGKQAEETEQEALPKVKLGAAVREEVEQVEMKQLYLQQTYLECIQDMLKEKNGKLKS